MNMWYYIYNPWLSLPQQPSSIRYVSCPIICNTDITTDICNSYKWAVALHNRQIQWMIKPAYIVFLTTIYCTGGQPFVLRLWAHTSRHPPSTCFMRSIGREEEGGRGGNRQRKGREKVDLSEACVRGIPCWCQFHFSSSMLRSFSLPQRENTPTGPETQKLRRDTDTGNNCKDMRT